MSNEIKIKVDFSKLKSLREKTDVSFSLCKKALEESSNNIEDAKKLLTKWGAKKLTEKSDRSTSQGAIFSYVHHNKKIASLVEIQCETDFVSGNAQFQTLGQEFAMQLASMPAETIDELMNQEYVRDPSKKMGDLFKETALKFGENMKLTRILRWALGN
ncbi:hypothetical protein A2334_05645 [Candidatus Roizmanbacteria bacterium RIFOXYB2_FULL_38_10]|uniref:Elongation factor Ts n=1 Tax=Candidatus Roizmanbacteria bacterium RIFOXYD1_FULL_38_12 TaxID=1802093 RepID=A0A1F7L0M3_9BACT|nr:MAG: hypothetical protein A3K47_02765 [Candidatus Roizmanbacteria bacterium RIFOXYA2_FULL_38_14]OGK63690.1 MAG: hypothetical protein A3K27_02765 [Candidatus Roizmanbacteria bacterium RIFOXYA1_FULL_37_12]OGK65536.1 MAG: hypothetical protein A3K38_02765 [Candidatus Roizmanbacteria bacterium RIFOXYB1_FULL_40_23]OGK68320.1 MAG: hypothetical protein A2334_05645 [Candidatus Roizmanbacteria bacterium RIFOXYB2_FULL_38_10]OGK69941.1 MAG: hypothetical protein A3K21_02770 [Candidatus Roizmanbacteria ba